MLTYKELLQFTVLIYDYMPHLNTSSAFFPLVEAPLHCNHRCNSTTLSVFGSLPAREAPGISSSRALVIKETFELDVALHIFVVSM